MRTAGRGAQGGRAGGLRHVSCSPRHPSGPRCLLGLAAALAGKLPASCRRVLLGRQLPGREASEVTILRPHCHGFGKCGKCSVPPLPLARPSWPPAWLHPRGAVCVSVTTGGPSLPLESSPPPPHSSVSFRCPCCAGPPPGSPRTACGVDCWPLSSPRGVGPWSLTGAGLAWAPAGALLDFGHGC